jgi:hypothetical protein
MPFIDLERIALVSKVIKSLNLGSSRFNVFDPRYYPPPEDPLKKVALYFFVMVAMDHRLSRPGKPYEATVDGEKARGADLLYRLGMKMYREKPEFFDSTNLAKVTTDDVIAWLHIDEARVPDPQLRALLLRDLGQKLLSLYSGDVLALIHHSKGYLRSLEGYGLLDLLKIFKAYQDPVEKKSFLLVKFLVYRGVFRPRDVENLHVAVDNHLTRVALRLGIIRLEEMLFKKVLNEIELLHDEDILIRISVREGFKAMSKESDVDVFLLDDFFWLFGRSICMQRNPKCFSCPFRWVCRAYEENIFVNDLNYYNTWYY